MPNSISKSDFNFRSSYNKGLTWRAYIPGQVSEGLVFVVFVPTAMLSKSGVSGMQADDQKMFPPVMGIALRGQKTKANKRAQKTKKAQFLRKQVQPRFIFR